MIDKVRDKIVGKRIVLKRTTPSVPVAQNIFEVIDKNRKHLEPWFPWVKSTTTLEDSLKYLFDKEEQFKKKEKFEYGIYLNDKYLGNIGIFSINKDKKSAEIGYWLSAEFINNGYVTEALKLVEKEFFTRTDINRIQIRCDEINIASASVAKKCGYVFEGITRENLYDKYSRKFRNSLVFSKLKSEFKKQKN